MIDTVALHRNYVSKLVLNKLSENVDCEIKNTRQTICSAINGECKTTSNVGNINLQVKFVLNNHTCNETSFTISSCFTILDTPFDIIIGRPTITEFNMLPQFFPNQYATNSKISEEVQSVTRKTWSEVSQPIQNLTSTLALIYRMNQSKNVYKRASIHEFLEVDEASGTPEGEECLSFREDGIENDPFLEDKSRIDSLPELIFGSAMLQEKLRNLCMEYKDIFSMSLKSTPANIPAFEILCDTEKWKSNKNRLPPRMQTAMKQKETIRVKQRKCLKTKSSSLQKIQNTAKFY